MNEATTAGRRAAPTVMVRYSVLSEVLVNLQTEKDRGRLICSQGTKGGKQRASNGAQSKPQV